MAVAQGAENMEISETWPDIYDEGYRDGVSNKRIPKIFGHISHYPNDLCKIFFTSFNLNPFLFLYRGN